MGASSLPEADRRMIASLCTVAACLLVILVARPAAVTASETCRQGADPCTSRIGHIADGNQSLTSIARLYGVTVGEILGANNFNLTEASVTTKLVPKQKLVQVPLTCDCISDERRTNKTVYTVKGGDTLDNIARQLFSGLVTFKEIGDANNISNVNDIKVGQKFVIPFPCACYNNSRNGVATVFLSYGIQQGDDLSAIAATYDTTLKDLVDLNDIRNLSAIQVGDVIEIPLSACFTQFNAKASDYGLLVPSGTYSLSPGAGCVQSSCYGTPTPELHSIRAPKLLNSKAKCPSLDCGKLALGDFNTSQSGTDLCTVTTCAYDGYANSSAIFHTLDLSNQTTCPVKTAAPPEQQVESVPSPPGSASPAPAPSSPSASGGLAAIESVRVRSTVMTIVISIPVFWLLGAF